MTPEDRTVALDVAFPAHAELITRLRAQNAEFDEMCRDFIAIATLIAADPDGPGLKDMLDSLAGLKNDIECKLAGVGSNPGDLLEGRS